jgi:hypothetical protein
MLIDRFWRGGEKDAFEEEINYCLRINSTLFEDAPQEKDD